MTAVLDSPASETDDLQEVFRRVLALDAAIERCATGHPTPGDLLLLQENGYPNSELARNEWENRLKGLRYRQAKAGSNAQLAAAERRIVETEKAFADADRTLSPKLERARAEVQRLERELQSFTDAVGKAHETVSEMKTSRRMIAEKLLPPLLKRLQNQAVIRSIQRYKPEMSRLRALATGKDYPERVKLENQVKELQQQAIDDVDTTYWECYLPKDPE